MTQFGAEEINSEMFDINLVEKTKQGPNAPERTCLITREAVVNLLLCTACQVRSSSGDAWMNETYFGKGENFHTAIQTLNPRLVDYYHALSHRG
jgi:hypothetical protein